MLDNYDKQLKAKVLLDLTNRARGGIALYSVIWFITALWADLHNEMPFFFFINSIIILSFSYFRLTHYLQMMKNEEQNIDELSRRLILIILIGAIHWGLLSAWIITHDAFNDIHYTFIIITTAFTMGGTSNFSISKEIRQLFPYFMLVPSILAGAVVGGSENLLFVTIAVFSLIYIVSTAKISANDYWEATHNHWLAESRAQLMEELSITDPLTKLKNRLFFNSQYSTEWKHCSRNKVPITIMMIDLDHFIKVNDTYGHQFGDTCLIEVASTLSKELLRETDTVARYGGEEFIVILPSTGLDDAISLAESIVNSITKIKLVYENKLVPISCSIGLQSIIPSSNDNTENLIKEADNALYIAKNRGEKSILCG